MSVRAQAAQAASAILTWGLRALAHRPAANLPGIVGLKLDPQLICELRGRIHDGSFVVVGTNGKTTVTNLIADVLERAGRSVVCNRTGANLKSGVASALLHTRGADWGVIECDELWSAKVLPDLRPSYLVLLNLFRDQLDRCGEIDRIQDAIVAGLAGSPDTTLIYNADDPLCETIARRAAAEPTRAASPASISFGVDGCMNLEQNLVADATMCQSCCSMLTYGYRQYGQLGAYECPTCGFTRPPLAFAGMDVCLHSSGLTFDIFDRETRCTSQLSTKLSGSYMVYNLLAVFTAAMQADCPPKVVQAAVNAFNPKNGRLQEYTVDGRRVLLNLAKNPTGFNQNLRIVGADQGPRAVAFFINDRDVDGRDISWIWDIDFEELLSQPNIQAVFAGGTRKNDLQVRLKHAGVHARLVDGIQDVFACLQGETEIGPETSIYAIANYTALPPVHAALDQLADAKSASQAHDIHDAHADDEAVDTAEIVGVCVNRIAPAEPCAPSSSAPVRIIHVLPDLLNLYGDGGNVRILANRLRWRDIPVEVQKVCYGEPLELDDADLVFIGGSPDREQRLASEVLGDVRDELAAYIDAGGPVLAICGGYQMLGRTWLLDGEEVPGLAILPMETRRPGTSADRLVDNIALDSSLATLPVIGYENHAGRTVLDSSATPFGRVVSHTGRGNTDETGPGQGVDGILHQNVVGTYLHGPLLAKNPQVADWLLERALKRWAARTKNVPVELQPLDDAVEEAANAFMAQQIIR